MKKLIFTFPSLSIPDLALYNWCVIAIFLMIFSIYSKDGDEVGQLKVGNFALPASQEIAPLFSFGQHVIEKGVLQAYSYVSWLKGKKQENLLIAPSLLYGITDELSFFINIPVYITNKVDNKKSTGISDISGTFEYAYYNTNSLTASNTFTVLAALSLPTGSNSFSLSTDFNSKIPSTGFGSTSFFLGTTFAHLAIDWYVYTSYGVILTTSKNNNKIGNEFLYQFGFGKNIPTSPKWIFTWIIECNGYYDQHDRIGKIIDPNSGGNSIYIGPSLWLSSEKYIFQAGISFPAYQNLFGCQNKNDFWAILSIAYTV